MDQEAMHGVKKRLILQAGVGWIVAAVVLPFCTAAIRGARAATVAGAQSWRHSKLRALIGRREGGANL